MFSRGIGCVAVGVAAAAVVAPAQAARSVSHDAYAALLKESDARVTRVETPLERAFGSKTATVSELKKLMLASAAVSTQLGHEFGSVLPPEPAAQKAGRVLARGELDLGAETRFLALHLPPSKAAALAYIQRQHPKGGPEVDRALAELKAAGYRTGS
jgi:hypothetical protein